MGLKLVMLRVEMVYMLLTVVTERYICIGGVTLSLTVHLEDTAVTIMMQVTANRLYVLS